jgi:hypothetical protein
MPSTCPLCVREMTVLNKDALCKDCCEYTRMVEKAKEEYEKMMASGKYVSCEECGEPELLGDAKIYQRQVYCNECYETTMTTLMMYKEMAEIRSKAK